ncbi:MAG: hypothetical protein J7L21_06895, partial [Sulfurimonas sp.]|nr:hypothetical protein [Sulfurimonas sp.]
MKKIHNKSYQDKIAKRHHIHELKRKDKEYSGFVVPDNMDPSIFESEPKKRNIKELKTPKEFSFLYNPDESLGFFQDFMYYSEMADLIKIDMRETEDLTIEVLLYLISLHKINKSKDIKVDITIKAPEIEKLKGFMAQSGFSKYFKAATEVE